MAVYDHKICFVDGGKHCTDLGRGLSVEELAGGMTTQNLRQPAYHAQAA